MGFLQSSANRCRFPRSLALFKMLGHEKKEKEICAWDDCTEEQKCLRLGIFCQEPVNSGKNDPVLVNCERRMERQIEQHIDHCRPHFSNEEWDTLISAPPRPYPTMRPMDKDARCKHAVHGCAFEMSMMLFDVFMCDCCGRILVNHNDPKLPNVEGFHLNHFKNPSHPAYFCNCARHCRGGQFFF